MMGDLLRRGEELARAAQAEATNEIAERLTRLLKGVTMATLPWRLSSSPG